MQSFAEVIRLGSFSEAAKNLGLSRALISRHVSDLEKHLGVPLLTRTTRRITPTEFGANHFVFCQRLIKEIEQSEAALKAAERTRGTTENHCAEVIDDSGFGRRHRQLRCDVSLSQYQLDAR
jgi:DNA-binding transcriptional LysR family regulator